MRWRLTYVIRAHSITEDEPLWTNKTHIWNMEDIETDADAVDKAKIFLESMVRQNVSIERYDLVRVVQEEVVAFVKIPSLKSYSELRWPRDIVAI